MESISEPWNEDDCEAVEGVMAGPECRKHGRDTARMFCGRQLRQWIDVIAGMPFARMLR
jgi:hypothetical protein